MNERIHKLKEFLDKNPADNFLQHALALEYSKIGDDVQARQLFEEILTRDPGYIGSYYHLAQLLQRNGETALAVQWYERGMEAAPVARLGQVERTRSGDYGAIRGWPPFGSAPDAGESIGSMAAALPVRVSERLTYLDRPSNAVTIGLQWNFVR